MARKKLKFEVTNEDFIEEETFDRLDIPFAEAENRFTSLFLVIALILNIICYYVLDKYLFADLFKISYANNLYVITILYFIFKCSIINLIASMFSIEYSFYERTLYEDEEEKFSYQLILVIIVYSLFYGLVAYFLSSFDLLHAIILGVINMSTMFLMLPGLVHDVNRLYIYH